MKNTRTTINIILDRIRRNPLLSDIPFETVADYAVDFMIIEGFPSFFKEKVANVKIDKYRGLLPFDCAEVKAVRGFLGPNKDIRPISFREATDVFMKSKNNRYANDFTYKISGNIIYSSMEKCDLEIVYSAFEVDMNGFPLIPDNRKFFLALESYIKVKHFESLFEQGKLDARVLDHAETQYYWAVGQCESEFHKISTDMAESIGNQWRQILINTNEHLSGYANLGIKKDYKIK